jgi:acyl-CoA thioester hydrolase
VAHRGTSSVKYEVGLFAKDAPFTAACGHFVHVYVSKQTRRPQALSESFIKVLEALS